MTLEQGPSWQKWTSRTVRPRERFDAWQDMLNRSHLSWALEADTPNRFFAELDIGRLAGLQMVKTVCAPCSGTRRQREIARESTPYFGLLLVSQGQEEVIYRGQSSLLEPGWSLIWDSTEPISFSLHSAIRKITLFVTQDRLLDTLPQVHALVGRPVNWQRGLGAVAASHLSALVTEMPCVAEPQAGPMAENTLELIATCLDNGTVPAGGAAQADLLARIKHHVETRLEDPELGPHELARRFGISVRYLHLLFKEEDLSVSRWIQERRLEKCRRELVRSGSRKNVTEIATQWGFNDSAHFSRVFKKRFGVSPNKLRNRDRA